MKKFIKNNKGFTMVELIVVIAIIAVLAVVLAPQYLKFVEDARISNDISAAASIQKTITMMCADNTLETNDVVLWNTVAGTIVVTDGTGDATAQQEKQDELDSMIDATVAQSENAKTFSQGGNGNAGELTWTIAVTDGYPQPNDLSAEYEAWDD